MPPSAACTAVCCCEPLGSTAATRENAEPVIVDRQLPASNAIAFPARPGCTCRAQAPVAPEPKGQPEVERGNDADDHTAVPGRFGNIAPRWVGSMPTMVSSPQKSALYLRHSRLLI